MNARYFLKFASILSLLLIWSSSTIIAKDKVVVGAERMSEYLPLLEGKRVGLVINHTSVVGNPHTHLLDTLLALKVNIVAAFAPEHGFRGDVDAGEVVKNGKDSRTNTPIISLYGSNKKPTAEQLKGVDIMLFDIQDVGARFYTYISTMHYVMEACADHNKQVIVLDRPNPCDYTDGPILEPALRSFVGMHPIPILHGCTVGELARMINGEKWLKSSTPQCQLTVIPMEGWVHGQPYSLPIKPSPNLPNDKAIQLYASLCAFEATQISVGRGTTFPFQVLGAPNKKYGEFTFTPHSLAGFDKNPLHKDKMCYGVDLRQATDIKGFSLHYVIEFFQKSGEGAAFFSRARWMDLLMGTSKVRTAIVAGKSEAEIRAEWQPTLHKYIKMREKYLLY